MEGEIEKTANAIRQEFKRYCKLLTLAEEIDEGETWSKNRRIKVDADFRNIYKQVLAIEQVSLENKHYFEKGDIGPIQFEKKQSDLIRQIAVLKFDFYSDVSIQIAEFENELNLYMKNNGVTTKRIATQTLIFGLESGQKSEIIEKKRGQLEKMAEIIKVTRGKITEVGAPEPVGDPETYIRLGNFYADGNKWEKAQGYYEDALVLDFNSEDAWNSLGNVYSAQKDYSEAIRHFKRAIEINPNYVWAWYNLGNTYLDQLPHEINTISIVKKTTKYLKEAISCYEKALEIDPNYIYAWLNLGNIYFYMGDQSAILCFKKALEIDPDCMSAWYNLGNTYFHFGNFPEAIRNYKKAIEINPDMWQFWFNLGLSYDFMKNYEQAIRNYKKAIEINPDDAKSWETLGKVYKIQGNKEEAKRCCANANLIRKRTR